jgi:chemotaxis protein MotB
MSKPTMSRAESGVSGSQPPRRVRWRLWLYAIVITGAAGAAGYFAWQFRERESASVTALAACTTEHDALKSTAADTALQLDGCAKELDVATSTAKTLEKASSDATKDLSATKEELTQLRAQKAESDKRMAAIEDIRKQFAKMIDTGQLRVSARRGQLVLSLPSEVLFPTGSSELSKQGEYAVVEVAAVLKRLPDRRFMVIGHTDNQDFAKPKEGVCAPQDNWQLSTARALSVVKILVTAGMDARSLVPAGVGANDPIADNATASGRQKNRRIEIALLPALDELPPLPTTLAEESAPPAKK